MNSAVVGSVEMLPIRGHTGPGVNVDIIGYLLLSLAKVTMRFLTTRVIESLDTLSDAAGHS